MKKIANTLFLLLLFVSVSGQNDTIRGIITGEKGYAVEHAKISQNENHFTYSGAYGTFILPLDPGYAKSIEITHPDYDPVIVNRLDTLSGLLKIKLKSARKGDEKRALKYEENVADSLYAREKNTLQLFEKFGGQFHTVDFDIFEVELGTYNTEVLSDLNGFSHIEMGFAKQSNYYGFNYGYSTYEDEDLDSIAIEVNMHHYGLLMGKLKDFKHFQIALNLGLSVDRWRLQNYDKDKLVTMQQYIDRKELDLRFNQICGFAGLNLTFKLTQTEKGFWGLDFFAGYVFPVSKTLIYSAQSRIENEKRLSYSPLTFGFGLTFANF